MAAQPLIRECICGEEVRMTSDALTCQKCPHKAYCSETCGKQNHRKNKTHKYLKATFSSLQDLQIVESHAEMKLQAVTSAFDDLSFTASGAIGGSVLSYGTVVSSAAYSGATVAEALAIAVSPTILGPAAAIGGAFGQVILLQNDVATIKQKLDSGEIDRRAHNEFVTQAKAKRGSTALSTLGGAGIGFAYGGPVGAVAGAVVGAVAGGRTAHYMFDDTDRILRDLIQRRESKHLRDAVIMFFPGQRNTMESFLADPERLNTSVLTNRFHKLSKTHHPDNPDGSHEAWIQFCTSYRILTEFVSSRDRR